MAKSAIISAARRHREAAVRGTEDLAPVSFSVDSSTTGVPKYRMLGVMATWSRVCSEIMG